MKHLFKYIFVGVLVVAMVSYRPLNKPEQMVDQLKGAWIHEHNKDEEVLMFIDGYHTHSVYNKSTKVFSGTSGGTYTVDGSKLNVNVEFDTKESGRIGQLQAYEFTIRNDELTVTANGKGTTFKRIDDGSAPLAGLWSITARMQDGKIVPIHRSGTRKTIKILSGSRFQWAAIDPGSKQFSGTGGGSYSFENGKYTENIEFFSRDSSRVGAKLSFDGKLENGDWHHSGLSSKGDNIYEIWGRSNK